MRLLTTLICFALTFSVLGQMQFEALGTEIGPSTLSLKKPPKYDKHSPCRVTFINYTNAPMQINWLHPSGRMQKLMYVDRKDTVSFDSHTNHHLVVCNEGTWAGSVFIPAFDHNLCRIHDKQFVRLKKISKRKYKPIKGDVSVDKKFKYKPAVTTYGAGKGPVVYFDEAHLTNNSMFRMYKPFATMLENDGYEVKPYYINFTKQGLSTGKIMIMSNAYGQSVNGWMVDSAQALIKKEVAALKEWVNEGGRLLLIMDHTPYPGRVSNIAEAFGFTFMDCHVIDTANREPGKLFNLEYQTLANNVLVKGRNSNEELDQVATFAGSCMKIPDAAKSVLTLGKTDVAVFSHGAWKLEQTDYRESADGYSQGAIMDYGEGKIAVFCDAEMFTATKNSATKQNIGMNYKYANRNAQYVLNVVHWLDGFIE